MRFRAACTWLLGAVAAIAVAIAAIVAFGVASGSFRLVKIYTASMGDTAPPGSVAVQVPASTDSLDVGDVITYRIPVGDHRLVTHRIVEVVEGGRHPVIRTKGDAVREPDPWAARLTGDQVWRTVGALPKMGYVASWFQTAAGRGAALLLAPIALCLIYLRQLWRRPRPAKAATVMRPIAAAEVAARPELPPRRRRARSVIGGAVIVAAAVLASAWPASASMADSDHVQASYGTDRLQAATNLAASAACSTLLQARANLTWTATPSSWAAGYELERATASAGPYVVVATINGRNVTTYQDSGLALASTYYYRIRATKLLWRSAYAGPVSVNTPALCL